MKLAGGAEDLLEFDREFFNSKCEAVFPHRLDIWSHDGLVRDAQGLWVHRVVVMMEESDPLAHLGLHV